MLWGRQGRRAHTLHLTLTPSPTPHPHPHSHSSGKFHMKVKKGIDYNAEIPFERPVPAGFFEVTQEADHANLKDFKSIVLQNVDEVGMPATAKTARANTTQLAAHNPQSPQSPPFSSLPLSSLPLSPDFLIGFILVVFASPPLCDSHTFPSHIFLLCVRASVFVSVFVSLCVWVFLCLSVGPCVCVPQ